MAFHNSPERQNICSHVQTGILAVNRAVLVLRDGHSRLADSIGIAYSPDAIRDFHTAADAAVNSFASAQEITSTWFDRISAEISKNLEMQNHLRDREHDSEMQASRLRAEKDATAKQVETRSANLNAANQSLVHADNILRKAQNELESARDRRIVVGMASIFTAFILPATLFLTIPLNAATISAVDDARSARNVVERQVADSRRTLEEAQQQLAQLNTQLANEERTLAEMTTECASLNAQKNDLEHIKSQLVLVNVEVYNSLHVVDSALGSAQMMGSNTSLTVIVSSIHGLVDALQGGAEPLFAPQLAELDGVEVGKLDERIRILKAVPYGRHGDLILSLNFLQFDSLLTSSSVPGDVRVARKRVSTANG